MWHLQALACTLLWLAGCSPALDWRRIRPEGLGVEALFPCRPASHARQVILAGETVTMTLHACSVDGLTFGLASIDLPDVRQVDVALAELVSAAARNISGAVDSDGAAAVPGMTPSAYSRLVRMAGRMPDGRDVIEHAAVFARGSRVFQATLLGAAPAPDVVEAFFAGLKVRS